MRIALATMVIFGAIFGSVAPVARAQEPVVVVPGPAGDPSPAELSRARDRFAEGTAAAEAGRWADALGAFRDAYTLSGVSAALYNVGTTYRSLGRHVAARDTFEQLLRDHPELPGDTRAEVEGLRNEVAARVAVLELQGLPADGELGVRLDGREVEVADERPVVVETEGGRHTVRVTRPAHEPFVWEGAVAEGDRRTIDVELVARPAATEPTSEGGMSTAGKVILITALGLVVAGAAVTAGVLLADDGLSPQSDLVVEL